MSTLLLPLFPAIEPYATHRWPVGGGHVVHVTESGNRDGLPLLVLHGGPGSGSSPLLRRFADPARFRIVCIDQRGSGLSTPRGGTVHNTTADLLDDIRTVREALGLQRWLVFGGSWGSTLALAHALHEPQAVTGLLLRSLFLAREQDVVDFFDGSGELRRWSAAALAAGSATAQARAAQAWWQWERAQSGAAGATGAAQPAPSADLAGEALAAMVDRYRVQSHYLEHRCWLDAPPLIDRLAALPPLPVTLVHGTHDRICLPAAATLFVERVPHARLHWIDGAGHDPTHPGMIDATVRALDTWAAHGRFEADAS